MRINGREKIALLENLSDLYEKREPSNLTDCQNVKNPSLKGEVR